MYFQITAKQKPYTNVRGTLLESRFIFDPQRHVTSDVQFGLKSLMKSGILRSLSHIQKNDYMYIEFDIKQWQTWM